MSTRSASIVIAALIAIATRSGTGAVDPRTLACSIPDLQRKSPEGTKIVRATVVESNGTTPRHCFVEATVATPGNEVAVRVGLPESWNGKFYFEGVGVFGGTFGSLNAGLERGYASASTDTGHRAAPTDASWAAGNPAKVIDYAYRGTHVTTVAAKALTHAYYRSAPTHAYFNGCSNGGRQALMEAQRYPEDFDGLIAGDPSLGTLGQIRRTLTYQQMLSSPDRFLPASKVTLLARKSLESCDAADGLADGLISDPRACQFRPETLACSSGDAADCLTAGELDTVKAIYADQMTPSGAVLPGFPVGHEDGTTGWQQWITSATPPAVQPDGKPAFASGPLGFRIQDGFLKYLASPDGQPIDWRTFSFAADGSRLDATTGMFSPDDPGLAGLRRRGGKLLLYHGWADPAISAYGTLRYYDSVVKAAGRDATSADVIRLFMVPGMHHCQGSGPGPNTFDMLSALENWVERGSAPVRIVASHSTAGVVDRTRPICAYPMVARYSGTGSVDAAENFRCEAPSNRVPVGEVQR